ncbi:MAG: thiamine phosphate synthase [Gemmataceae bacterium]
MAHQTSPGVDRALAEAKVIALAAGVSRVPLVHYLTALFGEPEGRPASFVARLGHDPAELVTRLSRVASSHFAPENQLLDYAREWSLARRGDPTLMTDALLVAVLRANPEAWRGFEPFDTMADAIEQLLGAEPSPMAGPDEPPVSFDFKEEAEPRPEAGKGESEPENLGAARVLDANFNRSREALRVLDDYARFVLDDAFLTGEIKAARHALAEAAKRLPARLLLASRDTLGDVGTAATAGGEYERSTPRHVAQVNLKRLQESLRSLEEFGKLFDPELARELEALRYRSYTLERSLAFTSDSRDRLRDARLYVLLGGSQAERIIGEAAAGGAGVFQLREKSLPDRELMECARHFRRWTRAAGVLFIMNDRPDIAKLVEADGVHLGQDDLPVREARRILGPEPLIGVSTHSLAQVRQALRDGADYLGVGPVFPSSTKSFDAFPGLKFVQQAAAETSLPTFALGGIGPSNIGKVIAAGARRVAVSSCIATAEDPESVARSLRAALGE